MQTQNLKNYDEEIKRLYAIHQNGWTVGDLLGIPGQYVYVRIKKLGIPLKKREFSEEDFQYLEKNYFAYRQNRKLDDLAKIMGRTKQFIVRKAKVLGLTNKWDSFKQETKYSKESIELMFKDYSEKNVNIKEFCRNRKICPAQFARLCKIHFGEIYESIIEERKLSTMYRKGRAYEYQVRDIFEASGFWCIRAAQSRGEADIVAIKDGYTFLIQCKNGGKMGNKESNELYLLAKRIKAIPVVFNKRKEGTLSYIITKELEFKEKSESKFWYFDKSEVGLLVEKAKIFLAT